MKRKMKFCCFSGHRIEKLPCSVQQLKELMHEAISTAIREGYDTFYHGGCTGVDLISAEQVIEIRKQVPRQICLIDVLPYEGQANHWNTFWRDRYYSVMEQSDEVLTLSRHYFYGCYQQRNRYMVDRSRRAIVLYDGISSGGTRNTIFYASSRGLEIQMVQYNLEKRAPKFQG